MNPNAGFGTKARLLLCWRRGSGLASKLDFPPLLFGKLLARLLTAESTWSVKIAQYSLIAALFPVTCVYQRNSPLVPASLLL